MVLGEGGRIATAAIAQYASGTSGGDLSFFYVNVVWGEDYVDLFTSLSIPTLLSPRNLPSLPNLAASQMLIVTTAGDELRIRGSAIFARLEQTIDVVFLPIELWSAQKYELMNHAHRRAIEYVAGRGFCVFLSPDAILSDGTLVRLYELARTGRRVVAGFGPPVILEGIVPEFKALRQYRAGEALSLPPRDLVSMALRHLHPDMCHHNAASDYFPEKPYACFWDGPDGDGMLVRSLSLHPYLFDTRLIPAGEDLHNVTIDWALIPRFVTDWNSFYVETDLDNFCILGISSGRVRVKPGQLNRLDAEKLSLWLLRNDYAFLNRASFGYAIKLHSGPLNARWEELERRTRDFALDVIDPARSLRDWTMLGYAWSNGDATQTPRSSIPTRSRLPSDIETVVHSAGEGVQN